MSMIPLKQSVTITPVLLDENGNPQTDEWGRPVTGTPYTLKCRIQEGAKLTRSKLGEEVVSLAEIFFDKHPNISYEDEIKYTDEYGKVFEWHALNIEVKRGLNGKPILTVVSV